MKRTVVIYSGGMDSFTLLNKVIQDGYHVYTISFDYGQRHQKELKYAKNVCQTLNIIHKEIDIKNINSLLKGSALTDDLPIPLQSYDVSTMKTTVVPNRNMILISLATAYAISLQATCIFYGAHHDDGAVYPDCRPEFVSKINEVTNICDWTPITVYAPYLNATKTDILKDGLAMNLDYSQTWTCYNGKSLACGACGACLSRLKAFQNLGITDPIHYQESSRISSIQA